MKLTGLSEQSDNGRDVFIRQEGAHVMLSVDAQDGARQGTTLLTPAQARSVSEALALMAAIADQVEDMDGQP